MSKFDLLDKEIAEEDLKVIQAENKLFKAFENYFEGRSDIEYDIFCLLDLILEHLDSDTCYPALSGLLFQMDALVNK
jgi:hypothetical protein